MNIMVIKNLNLVRTALKNCAFFRFVLISNESYSVHCICSHQQNSFFSQCITHAIRLQFSFDRAAVSAVCAPHCSSCWSTRCLLSNWVCERTRLKHTCGTRLLKVAVDPRRWRATPTDTHSLSISTAEPAPGSERSTSELMWSQSAILRFTKTAPLKSAQTGTRCIRRRRCRRRL